MSVLELKGEIHDLIAQVRSRTAAQKLLEIIQNFLQSQPETEEEDDDFEDRMTDEQVLALNDAIEHSFEKRNLIPQAEAKQMLQLWLKQKQSNG